MSQTPAKNLFRAVINPPKLTDFLGKAYVLDYSENYEDFLREIGVKEKTISQAVKTKPTVMLAQDNDQYILSTSYPQGRHLKLKFKPGQVINRRRSKLNPTRSEFFVEGNKLIEELNVDGKKVMIEREFRKRDLFVTMEVNGVKCFRLFVKSEGSMHSIQTETSRWSSLWDKDLPEEPSIEEENRSSEITEINDTVEIEQQNLCY